MAKYKFLPPKTVEEAERRRVTTIALVNDLKDEIIQLEKSRSLCAKEIEALNKWIKNADNIATHKEASKEEVQEE